MRKPWELTPDKIHTLVLAGVEPDEIQGLNDARYEAYMEMLTEIYGDEDEEAAEHHFFHKYGFDHDCHCVDDVFTGNTVRIPRCRFKMGDDALDALEAVNIERDELVEQVDALRRQIAELGEVPVA